VKPFLNTYSNRRVNPLDVQPKDISLFDIAHALSLCNRFAGHTRWPISVAQHSVWVSRLCDDGVDYEVPMAALLHDASEAYLGDVTKWLKNTPEMQPYRDAEDRAMQTILKVFECENGLTKAVNDADRLMVCWEAEIGISGFFEYELPPGYERVSGSLRDRLKREWKFVDWKTAEDDFRYRFSDLIARKYRYDRI